VHPHLVVAGPGELDLRGQRVRHPAVQEGRQRQREALQQRRPELALDRRGIWAPDVIYHNSKYKLYYSLHGPTNPDSAIGVATSDNPDGPWTDHGKVVNGNNNSIDPDIVEHNGDLYMFFGSYSSPMHVTKLTADGLNDASGRATGSRSPATARTPPGSRQPTSSSATATSTCSARTRSAA
jgi:beta-xylosidase